MGNTAITDGIHLGFGITKVVLEDLICLGYDRYAYGVSIIHDGKEASREFAKLLSGRLKGDNIETSIQGRDEDTLKEYYNAFRLAKAAHQMSQVIYLPALTVFLTDEEDSLRVDIYDPFLDLFGIRRVDGNEWDKFNLYQTSAHSNFCKGGKIPLPICERKPPAGSRKTINLIAKDVNEIYKKSAGAAGKTLDGELTCNPLEKIKLEEKSLYYFQKISKEEPSLKKLKEEWTRLFDKFSKIGFMAIPSGAEWDTYPRNDRMVFLDHATVKNNSYAPFTVYGDITSIILYSKAGSIFEAQPSLPISIDPSKPQNFSLDLTKLGYGIFSNIIRSQSHTAHSYYGANDEYGLIISSRSRLVPHIYDKELRNLADQISQAEQEFGFDSGGLVQVIYLVPCKDFNGEVITSIPSTMIVCDTVLDRISQEPNFIPHEMAHMLDIRGNLTGEGWISQLFGHLKRIEEGSKFLNFVTESNFLWGSGGGHAKDDVTEYFASLISSLHHSKWQQKVFETEDGFLKWYLISLVAVFREIALVKKMKDASGKNIKLTNKIESAIFHLCGLLGLNAKLEAGVKNEQSLVRIVKEASNLGVKNQLPSF